MSARREDRAQSDAELASTSLVGDTALAASLRRKIANAEYWAVHATNAAQREGQKALIAKWKQALRGLKA